MFISHEEFTKYNRSISLDLEIKIMTYFHWQKKWTETLGTF